MEDQTVSFSLEKTVAHLIADQIGGPKIKHTFGKVSVTSMIDVREVETFPQIVIYLVYNRVEIIFGKAKFNSRFYPKLIQMAPMLEKGVKRRITAHDTTNISWLTMGQFQQTEKRIADGESFMFMLEPYRLYMIGNQQPILYYYDGLLGLYDLTDKNWINCLPVLDRRSNQQEAFELMKSIIFHATMN